MANIPMEHRTGAIDFGAFHGMLSIRAKLIGWPRVLGLELDGPSVDVFKQYLQPNVPGVTLQAAPLDVRSPEFAAQAASWVHQGYDP